MRYFPYLLAVLMLCRAADSTHAQQGSTARIYTVPDPSAGGGITLSTETPLTFAVAVERDRKRVFAGSVLPGGLQVRFEHLPTGKYDLVLMARSRNVFERIELGPEPQGLSETSLKNLKDRVATADTFYNRWTVHRVGIGDETALVFVERLRDKTIYQQSAEVLQNNVRRFEIIEMHQAADSWQVGDTRHLYRETEPLEPNPPFFKHSFVAELGGVRVIDQTKNLGKINLPSK